MQKKALVLRVSIAVALSVTGLPTSAAADEGPTGTPAPRPSLVAPALPREALIRFATSAATTAEALSDAAPVIEPASASTLAPPRAAAVARSYPRTFSTYDALTEHAVQVAAAQKAANDRLALLLAREDATRETLATVFDPRRRGGLLRSRADLIDDATIQSLETQVANDVIAARQLVADGAVVTTPTSWRLPLDGEDTQDFGPTSYYFEPSLTYRGVYYAHFHTGTDIAAAWGTPILAPAGGVVVFSGLMGDGAEVVVIAHESGLVSMYAHLAFPMRVKAGDRVQAGDPIGNVGLTGNTTGAHVHWSVWRDGELIDPLSMIPAK